MKKLFTRIDRESTREN